MPSPLCSGDTVALVAPAYHMNDSLVAVSCELLKEYGFVPVLGKNALKRYPDVEGYSSFAGSIEERKEDLLWALNDKQVKGIICLTGGYGSVHLVSKEVADAFRNNPKWFVGCSDITTLLMASVDAGVMSIHGNMCIAFAQKGMEDAGNIAVLDALKGIFPNYELPADSLNINGKAKGMLVGGNMTNIVPLLGTEYDCFEGHDCILFIEEVGESMHCIERQLSAILLHHSDRIKGVIVGDFVDCGKEFGFERGVEGMIHSRLKDMGIPVCFGFHGGHADLNLPLIEGAEVTLQVTGTSVSICEAAASNELTEE